MPLKPAAPFVNPTGSIVADQYIEQAKVPSKSYGETRDARIMYQGLTQACIQSMPLGQFATDIEGHLKNVMATVDALAVFILERAK